MTEAGLIVSDRHDSVLELDDYPVAATLFSLGVVANRAMTVAQVGPKEAVQWLRTLQQTSAQGSLRCSLADVIAGCIKPSDKWAKTL